MLHKKAMHSAVKVPPPLAAVSKRPSPSVGLCRSLRGGGRGAVHCMPRRQALSGFGGPDKTAYEGGLVG